jgi:formylglycine-generating enzyme required for sulfatase activity
LAAERQIGIGALAMGKIFICYRRLDSQDMAGRLHDKLESHFGDDAVFMDADSLSAGERFPQRIQATIAECDVFLALIGRQWLDARDGDGRRRLDDAEDWVRLEIEEALRQKVTPVPVLLHGAEMPSKKALPATLGKFTEFHAARLRPNPDFKHDVAKLIGEIEAAIAGRERQLEEERQRVAREQAEREAAERETAERGRAEQERAAKEAAERERMAHEQAAHEQAAREQAKREQAEREQAERQRAAHEAAERVRVEHERAANEAAERERVAHEQAEREQTEREQAYRQQAAAEASERVRAEHEQAANEAAERERSAHEQAKREPGSRQQVERERRGHFTNSIGMKLVLIPAGEFMMGSPEGEEGRQSDEDPQHRVRITQPFYLGSAEVTKAQWQAVMRTTPWKGWLFAKQSVQECADCPATHVSWDDAVAFCRTLSQRDGRAYRLPTEAEWEYACRAGSTGSYSFGDDSFRLGEYAWYEANVGDNGEKCARRVCQKRANPLVLYDMHGNVWEWCSDWGATDYYAESPPDDPQGPSTGSVRVRRGGGWSSGPLNCRSAYRSWAAQDGRSDHVGFRVACILAPPTDADAPPSLPREMSAQHTERQRAAQEVADRESAARHQAERERAARQSREDELQAAGRRENERRAASEFAMRREQAAQETAERERVAQQHTQRGFEEHHINSIGMKLLLIPAGEFMMGSPAGEVGRDDDEGPQHRVRITRPFYLGATEVTQGQWRAVMGTAPWRGWLVAHQNMREGTDYPATYVSWDDAMAFCRALGKRDGRAYRMPTEAEWEYACRAGSTSSYSFGDEDSRLRGHAWYAVNAADGAEKYAHRVGQKCANSLGLYDLHGNVWEWCSDWYARGYYAQSAADDPQGHPRGSIRSIRGGSWLDAPQDCRSAARNGAAARVRGNHLGFRVACSLH